MKNAEKVIVEKIYAAKEGKNQEFSTLQLRTTWVEKNFLNDLLGSDGFERSKVAFQSIKNSQIEKLGIKEGSDIGKALGQPMRIKHTESLDEGMGFQALINPETEEAVTSGGAQIYFKRELAPAHEEDVYVSRDTVEVNATATPESVEENL